VDKCYGETESAQRWKIDHKWLSKQNLYGIDENIPGDWLQVLAQGLRIHNVVCVEDICDNMEAIGIHLSWTLRV
jgi:hypothetical protein